MKDCVLLEETKQTKTKYRVGSWLDLWKKTGEMDEI